MPVIVDEVVISIQTTNQTAGENLTGQSNSEEKQEIISECVEQVLEILKQKEER